MSNEEKSNSSEPEDIPSRATGSKLEKTKLPEAGPEANNLAAPLATETTQAVEAIEQPVTQMVRPRHRWTKNREQRKRLHLL